ncbi:hypothetical protein SAY86_002215 [Trapa natans]|uniref:RING-type domain-containing protein n=1 Tax=Trapa natans TaxID=22666 RepID=A0AAN7LS11_TRANT|nr:hypothetical protein SAY86_002215 [Trapa natans]
MAIVDLQNPSVLASSILREPQPSSSRRSLDNGRRGNRASAILQMWRELEDEHGLSPRDRVSEQSLQPGIITSHGAISSINASESSLSGHEIVTDDASVSENGHDLSGSQSEMQSETVVGHNLDCVHSSDFGEAERERVRQIFREWMNSGVRERPSSDSSNNNSSRTVLGGTEQERVRIIREWMQTNGQRDSSDDTEEEQAAQIGVQIERVRDSLISNQSESSVEGTRRGIRRVCGRQVLLDMLKKAGSERRHEIQSLLEERPVSRFAHRKRIQSLLRGRFLRNERQVVNDKPSSTAASELGLLRQRQTVSGLREGFLLRLDSYSQASSSLSRTSSNCDIDDYGRDQDHPNGLPTDLNESTREFWTSNMEKDTCESSNARNDSEVTYEGFTRHEANDDAGQSLQPGAENEISSYKHSGSIRVDREEGGVSLDRINTALSDESWQTESAGHGHQASEAPLDFSGSEREEGPIDHFHQHTGDPGGSLSRNLRELSSTVEVEVQQPDHDLENEGVSLDAASKVMSDEAWQTGSADHRHQASLAPCNFSTEETSSSSFLQATDNPGGSNAQDLREQDSIVEMQQLHHDSENEYHHETSAVPVEPVHAIHEFFDERRESNLLQNQHGNEYTGGSVPSESSVGNQDDNFQGADQRWLEQPSEVDVIANGRVNTFYTPDDENVYNMELQELLSRRSVSNLLSSGFRQSLDQLIQSYVERQGQASNEWELHETPPHNLENVEHDLEQLNREDEGQMDDASMPRYVPRGFPIPVEQSRWDPDLHGDNWPQPHMHQHLGTEWDMVGDLRIDMARLQQRMNNMQRMLEACMDMQLELQRSIRQEVSAALNRSTVSSGLRETISTESDSRWERVRNGVCCICLDTKIDSLLYRCGHMCACLECANGLVQSRGKCPMCRAPVVEAVRAYFIL